MRSVGGEADGGAAEGAAGGGLDPRHGAGPVEAVGAGEVRQHVARPELLQAHRALRLLLLLLLRLLPPAPAEPPAASFLREHLPLQHGRPVLRRVVVVAGVPASGTARRDREPEASRAVTPASFSGKLLIKTLLLLLKVVINL